jgi:hypothetical protein
MKLGNTLIINLNKSGLIYKIIFLVMKLGEHWKKIKKTIKLIVFIGFHELCT